jgi:hypothetical protein
MATPKRPREPAQQAKFIVDLATGDAVDFEATPKVPGRQNGKRDI